MVLGDGEEENGSKSFGWGKEGQKFFLTQPNFWGKIRGRRSVLFFSMSIHLGLPIMIYLYSIVEMGAVCWLMLRSLSSIISLSPLALSSMSMDRSHLHLPRASFNRNSECMPYNIVTNLFYVLLSSLFSNHRSKLSLEL